MLVVKQNCIKVYKCTIFVLEVGLSLNAIVVYIKKQYLG